MRIWLVVSAQRVSSRKSEEEGAYLRRLRLNKSHVDILGVGQLILVESVMFNRSADPIMRCLSVCPITAKNKTWAFDLQPQRSSSALN